MSRRIADLLIKIGADSYEFQQKAKQVEKGLGALENKLTSFGKTMSLAVSAPLIAIGTVAVRSYDAVEKAAAKVRQAITTTGGAAQLSLKQLQDHASYLQSVTIFDDDDILNNVTAKLLAFTNIAGESFKRTQEAALDLSTVLDKDLNMITIQLGKALNDPVKNLSALSRMGVQFTKEQTQVINSLAQTNKLAEAQGIILDELAKKYGGQAQQAAKVGYGALQQLKNNWGDFLEQIGEIMMPVVVKISKALDKVVGILQNMNPKMLQTIVIVSGIAAAIAPLAFGIGGIIKMLPMLAVGFTALLSPIGLVVAGVLALGAAFFFARQRKKEMLEQMTDKFEDLGLYTLENRLKENKRLQAVNENESRWQGGSLASKVSYGNSKGSRRKELKMEEQALTEAIKRRTKAIEDQQLVEQESAKIAQEMKDILGGTTVEVVRGTGLLNDLKNKIEDLEKKKLLPSSTIDDIAGINVEIGKLKQELQNLENITPDQLNFKKFDPILSGDLAKLSPIAVPLELKISNLAPIVNKTNERMKMIRDTVRNEMYGWSGDLTRELLEDMMLTEQIVGNYTTALTEKGLSFTSALEFVASSVAETMRSFDDSLNAFLANSIAGAAEAIGQIMTGDLGFGGLMKAILSQFANFLKQIGTQMIQFGIMILAFKSALKSVLANPWGAIAIGAAMVAAAAVMTALINKKAKDNVPKLARGGLAFAPTYAMVGDNPNARVDPEVIAPLSKLKDMMTGGGAASLAITMSGELIAKGRDLVYVLGKENFKIDVLGG